MFLEKNLEALGTQNLMLTGKLLNIDTNKRFEVYMDEQDSANINIHDKELDDYLYQKKPIDEVQTQYADFMKDYSRYPFIFLYGIGNGVFTKMILEMDKTVIIYEPNLELLYIALNLIDFSKELKEGRLKLFLEEDITFMDLHKMCQNPQMKVFLKTYDLQPVSTYYEKHFLDNMLQINKDMVKQIAVVVTGEGNDAKDSLIGLDHHTKNLPKMINSYSIKELGEAVFKKHAVVVSTGPSLYKQLDLLKQYKDHLTILCVDASLPILQEKKIAPDLVFSLERVEATAKFYENLDKELLKDTIFVPSSVAHPKLLENLEGMKQSIPARPFGYTRMFKLNQWFSLGIGMSAANMAYEFAIASKIQNIAFIGQDLAFAEDGKTHSKGAVYGEKEKQYKYDLEIEGYYGGVVKTTKVWEMFLHFLKKDTVTAKQRGLNIYNCTEGGAKIEGAEHIPFKTFLEGVDKELVKQKITLTTLPEKKQQHYIKRSKKYMEVFVSETKKIKEKVEEVFLKVMEEIETLEKLNYEENLEEVDYDELANTISEIDKVKDIYEESKVILYMQTIAGPLIINAELDLATIMVQNTETETQKKAKMIEWIYKHKSWLFFLAGALDNVIFIMERNMQEL